MELGKLDCLVLDKVKGLELIFQDDIVCESPIMSYSGGFFYFFNTMDKFEKFSQYLASKPFFDEKFKRMKREIVGAYPCELNLVCDNKYLLKKSSSKDLSYDYLRDRILSSDCIDSGLTFENHGGIYIGR